MERALFQRLSSSSSSSSVFPCPISRSHCINPTPRVTARLHRWLTSHFPSHHQPPPLTSSFFLSPFPSPPLAKWCPKHSCNWAAKTASISSSAILSSGPGGGTNGFGGGSDGGGGGGDGGGGDASLDPAGDSGATITESTSSLEDVIFLDVGGMVCGGCASSVKRILESQAHVIHASVNLATEAAVVKVSLVSEVPLGSTKKEVGEALAKHLSNCGFKSSVREEPIGV